MDNHNSDRRGFESDRQGAGMIEKSTSLAPQEVTAAELKEINKYALEPLTAEEVFTFKAVLCDNEVDRDSERFSLTALRDFKKLFLGRPVIKDHAPRADNQVARVYATELVQSEKTTTFGEPYTQLVAHCYGVKTAGNADLIAEIKGGIKKEGSVGCSVSRSLCSICGKDNNKGHCAHWRGRSYNVGGELKTCTFTLDGGRDAYEFSLVAVPAQKAAGTCKSYTGELEFAPEEPPNEPHPETTDKAAELELRARLAAVKTKHNTKEE